MNKCSNTLPILYRSFVALGNVKVEAKSSICGIGFDQIIFCPFGNGKDMSLIKRMSQMPYFLLIFPPLFWAGNAVLARGVVGVVPPISLAYFRWLFAFLVILPFGIPYARQDWPLVKEKWLVIVALGFLGITCFNSMLYVSAKNHNIDQHCGVAKPLCRPWLFCLA